MSKIRERIEALRVQAEALREEASELAKAAFEHPRPGLWQPLSMVAVDLRSTVGQADLALTLLDTWPSGDTITLSLPARGTALAEPVRAE